MKNKNLKLKFKYVIEKIINYKFDMLYGCEDDGKNIIFDKIYFGERIIFRYEWDHEYELCNIIFEFKKNTYYIFDDDLYNFFDINIFELHEYSKLYTDTDLELCEYIIKLYEFFKLNEEIKQELNKIELQTTTKKRVKI